MLLECGALLLALVVVGADAFIVGGCIGPKSAFERYLTPAQRRELKRLVHESFDGSNQAAVLADVYEFVRRQITDSQWAEVYPEIEKYRQQGHECSVYAQLLPSNLYKQLITSVYRASETGADKHEVKRLVEEYIERLLLEGALDRLPTAAPPLKPAMPAAVLPVVRRVSQPARPATPTPFSSTTPRPTAPPSSSSFSSSTISEMAVRPAHYLVKAPPPPVRLTLRPPLSLSLLLTATTPQPTTEAAPRPQLQSLAQQFLRERFGGSRSSFPPPPRPVNRPAFGFGRGISGPQYPTPEMMPARSHRRPGVLVPRRVTPMYDEASSSNSTEVVDEDGFGIFSNEIGSPSSL